MKDFVGNYLFDARPDRIDLRDRLYLPPLVSLPDQTPGSGEIDRFRAEYVERFVLNQKRDGACTGFGLASTINYLIWRRGLSSSTAAAVDQERVSPRMLYHLARFYDEWPGEDYSGSSCRGAVKAWHKHGVCTESLWPFLDKRKRARFLSPKEGWETDAACRPLGVYYRIDKDSIVDMQAAIAEVGAIYVSADVHKGWNLPFIESERISHKTLPSIDWSEGKPTSGTHAFALIGYNARGFVVQNSWGRLWGWNGFGLLTYTDWTVNGCDAWVCVMGAPMLRRSDTHYLPSTREREQGATAALGGIPRGAKTAAREVAEGVRPWTEGEAYQHTVVMGNEGRVLNRLVAHENGTSAVKAVFEELPARFFTARGTGDKPRIAIYAHGGLNSEAESVERVQMLAPYFKANGIYPVFLTWRTGLLETILAIASDSVGRLFPHTEGLEDVLRQARGRVEDVFDRTLEAAAESLGVKAIWSQMKQNADAASRAEHDRGLYLAVGSIKALLRRFPRLEVHLVGHSAGSILLGHLLGLFRRRGLTVRSCTLYAAACTVDFANRHYARAAEAGVLKKQDLHFYLLSDRAELDDSVGPYRKSLLYLVSRALEDEHKTPLLGMANAFDPGLNHKWSGRPSEHLLPWQAFWGQRRVAEVDTEQVVSAARWEEGQISDVVARIDAAHGAFDNDVQIVDETIRRITGRRRLAHAVEDLRF
ncbi:MAG: C1 family peptidase [Pseudomonadota bacterium]